MPEAEKKIETLYSWKAPARPFKRRDRKWFLTVALLIAMPMVIAALIQDWVPIGALFALLFVLYVLASVPPEEVENKVTTQGVTTANHAYVWSELGTFWLTQQYGSLVVHVETRRLPGRISMLINQRDVEKIKSILVQYIPFREIPERSWVDRTAEWLGTFLPLEQEKK